MVYSGIAQSPTVQRINNLAASDTLSLSTLVYTGKQTVVGNNYTVTVSLPDDCVNYVLKSGEGSCSFKIIAKEISATWSQSSLVYNGHAQSPTVISLEGLVDDTLTLSQLSYNGAKTNAGDNYVATATLPAVGCNYVWAASAGSCTFKIQKAPLTLTVDSKNKTFDGKTFTESGGVFTYTNNGVVGDDTFAEIVAVSFSGEALTAVNAGVYEIDLSLVPASKFDNYDISVTKGLLTIEQKEITLEWNSSVLPYSGANQCVTVSSINGLIVGETAFSVNSLTYSGQQTNVGEYQTTAVLPQNCNYKFANSTTAVCNYTIVPQSITLKADDQTKVYDGKVFDANEYTCSLTSGSLMGTDKLSEVVTVSYTGTAATATTVGSSYVITPSVTAAVKYGNYNVSVENGTLTITQRALTLSWPAQDVYNYDGSVKSHIATVGNAVSGDDLGISYIYKKGSETVAVPKDVGNYSVTVQISNTNYTLPANVSADFTINAAELVLDWTNVQSSLKAEISGLAENDSENEVVSFVCYKDGVVTTLTETPTENGVYKVEIVVNSDNYTVKAGVDSYAEFTISD